MMRIYDGKAYRDMTPEEIAAWEQSITDPPPRSRPRMSELRRWRRS